MKEKQDVKMVQSHTVNHVKRSLMIFNLIAGGDLDASKAHPSSRQKIYKILEETADLGFEGVEWANLLSPIEMSDLFELDLSDLKSAMDKLGLETTSIHYHYGWIDTDEKICHAVETCRKLNCKNLVFAYATPETFGIRPDSDGNWTSQQISQWVNFMNTAMDKLMTAAAGTGIEVVYHNHADEFLKTADGDFVLDQIHCNAKEFDFYWAMKGLKSYDKALAYLKWHKNEVRMIHLKDGLRVNFGASGDMCSWGDGTYDLQGIINVARENHGIEWIVAENDNPANSGKTGLQDAVDSAGYARKQLVFERFTRKDICNRSN